MRFYLAGRYGRRKELLALRDTLVALGHEVTSGWLDTDWEKTDASASAHVPPAERVKYCLMDLRDIDRAQCVVSFTEEPDSTAGKRGGRHVEYGYAIGCAKLLVVIGPRENLFHSHPSCHVYPDVKAFLAGLSANELLERLFR